MFADRLVTDNHPLFIQKLRGRRGKTRWQAPASEIHMFGRVRGVSVERIMANRCSPAESVVAKICLVLSRERVTAARNGAGTPPRRRRAVRKWRFGADENRRGKSPRGSRTPLGVYPFLRERNARNAPRCNFLSAQSRAARQGAYSAY